MQASGLIAAAVTSMVVLGGASAPAHGSAVPAGPSSATVAERGPACGYSLMKYKRGGRVVAEICSGNQGRTWTLQARGAYRGVEKFMRIRVCRQEPRNRLSHCDGSRGRFEYYAGPVTAPGRCELFIVKMTDGRGRALVDDRKPNCG